MSGTCVCGRVSNAQCQCASATPTPEFRVGDEFEVRVRVERVHAEDETCTVSVSKEGLSPKEYVGFDFNSLRKARRVERPLAVGDRIVNAFNVYDKFGKIVAIDGVKAWVRYDSSNADALEYTENLRHA